MNPFDMILFTVKTLLLAHAVPIALVVGIVLLVLSIVFLGTGPAVLAFLRSRIGQVLIALVVAGVVGWELKGWVDDSVALERQLAQERREHDQAMAAERLRTAAAQQQAAEARRQAEALRAVAEAAATNEAAADAYAANLQGEVDEQNQDLADATQHPVADRAGHRLSDADVHGLCRIGSCAGPRRAKP